MQAPEPQPLATAIYKCPHAEQWACVKMSKWGGPQCSFWSPFSQPEKTNPHDLDQKGAKQIRMRLWGTTKPNCRRIIFAVFLKLPLIGLGGFVSKLAGALWGMAQDVGNEPRDSFLRKPQGIVYGSSFHHSLLSTSKNVEKPPQMGGFPFPRCLQNALAGRGSAGGDDALHLRGGQTSEAKRTQP